MSTDRETTHAVRSWLEEGVTRLPDRVLDAVLGQVPATPQRRSGWAAWRFTTMTNPVRYAIAAAAVLVVALIGYQFLPAPNIGGKPSAAPSTAPTVIPDLPTSGPIPAGTYQMGTGPKVMVTLPAGWVSVDGMNLRKNPDQPTELALDMWSAGLAVFTDACHSADTEERIGPTVDDLIAALEAQENSELADPVDVTIAGIDGTRLELSSPAGLELSECTIGTLQFWQADAGGWLAGVGPDGSGQVVHVADTPAGRLHLAKGDSNPAATAADNAELEAVWMSLRYVE